MGIRIYALPLDPSAGWCYYFYFAKLHVSPDENYHIERRV